MTIGPAPMIRIEEMSVRLGILLVHHLAFPAVVVATELIRPRLHLLRVGFEAVLVDRNRGLEHDALAICGGAVLHSPPWSRQQPVLQGCHDRRRTAYGAGSARCHRDRPTPNGPLHRD